MRPHSINASPGARGGSAAGRGGGRGNALGPRVGSRMSPGLEPPRGARAACTNVRTIENCVRLSRRRFTHLGAVQLYSTLLAIRTLLHLSSFGQATSFVALVHFDELHEVTWQERS